MKIHSLYILGFVLLTSAGVYAQNKNLPKNTAVDSLMHLPVKGGSIGKVVSMGHSHNDYEQNIPFYRAYYAGMESIEADIFLHNGELYVAHERKGIAVGRTLTAMYLEPMAKLFKQHGGQPFAKAGKPLQLLIDVKEDYAHAIPQLIKELKPYLFMVDRAQNKQAIRVVLTGDIPAPSNFSNYPSYLFYDGNIDLEYTADQLKQVALMSTSLKNFSVWNGKGTPAPDDVKKLRAVVAKAHQQGKPFRFWATEDMPNTWIELENLGVDWLNTDHPEQLQQYYEKRDQLSYSKAEANKVYTPTYLSDGGNGRVKNVILLIGDGMGLAQVQAGLVANHGSLSLGQFRYLGLSQTKSANSGNTDSAAGATAMASGEKTNNRYLGLDASGKQLMRLPDTLSTYGIKTGIITTGDVTDATPAAFYARQMERTQSEAIAVDFLNANVDILVGSNRKSFLVNPDKELMAKLKSKKYVYTDNTDAYLSSTAKKQVVLVADADTRAVKNGRGPVLGQWLEKTLGLLAADKEGCFIMAEGAQIDYGGHANDLPYLITEMLDFDQAIAAALRFADRDKETLVIVTADHETGGLSLLQSDEKTGTVRASFSTNDHTGIMVPVFAYGPHAQDFIGMYQNTEIYQRILEAITKGRKLKK